MSLTESDIDNRIGFIQGQRGARPHPWKRWPVSPRSAGQCCPGLAGRMSPTAQLLNKVCGGLGITLSEFFAQAERPSSPLARFADQPSWRDPGKPLSAAWRLRRRDHHLAEIVEIEFPPGESVAFDNDRVAGRISTFGCSTARSNCSSAARPSSARDRRLLLHALRPADPVSQPTARLTRYAVILSRS